MKIEHVPDHRLYSDDDRLAAEYVLDGQPIRAEFDRDEMTLTLDAVIIIMGEYERRADAGSEAVPPAIARALARRGFEFAEVEDEGEGDDEAAEQPDEATAEAAGRF